MKLSPGSICAAALAFADPRHAVHQRRVDAVEVHRVRVFGGVDEADPQPLALAGAQGRPGDAAVVGPGFVLDARRDFDLLVVGDDLPLAQDPAAGQAPGLAVVEVAQQLGRVEAVGAVVDGAAGGEGGVGEAAVAGVAGRGAVRARPARAASAPTPPREIRPCAGPAGCGDPPPRAAEQAAPADPSLPHRLRF